ncbi:uncharacterized protein LOC117179311 isoform X2 [Belonocnema kinseyi]|uniref:uncharacterized protein LOC117179311 isoform X2 n=1 Tax=Belonocnema kinseyi TaxID=2817044 RepID=UPI00143D3895|nr:uncharacterized protein LOC117179311 isoform X2 [Belonocnema kinseyi]
MDFKTCSNFNEEQLYMLEFLIDHIDLNTETMKRVENSSLSVNLKFIDFPVFDISQEEFLHAKKNVQGPNKSKSEKLKSGLVDFSMGKSCLFPKKPNDLVQAMRSTPLKVGIFIATEKNEYEPEEEKLPICETKVLLSGCLCNQVAMSMNDKNHLPKPYVIKNTYNLIDNQGDPSGTITLFLRLSCFGKSIVTQFALQDSSFLFKSSQSPNEFQCTKIPTESDIVQAGIYDSLRNQKDEVRSLKPQNVIGLSSICQELAKRDGGPPDLFPILPEVVSRKEMKELFRKEPNTDKEDTLGDFSDDRSHLKTLSRIQSYSGVGCAGGLCVGTKLLDPLPSNHHGASTKIPSYTGSYAAGGVQDCCKLFRMRGGGCCKDSGPGSARFGKQSRGIIDNPIFMHFSPGKDLPSNQTMETLVSGSCKSAWKNTATPGRTGCGCFGKRGAGLDHSGGTCSKKPCMGIDCIIRSFKEIQEFVDSIGKVPGLAGLGIMDPSESPYFGREEETGNTCRPKSKKSIQNPIEPTDAPNKNVSYAKTLLAKEKKMSEVKSKLELSTPSPYTATQTLSTFSTHSVRAVLNAQTKNMTHTLGKPKRREDRPEKPMHENQKPKQQIPPIEIDPSGEPKCKSKKRKGKENMEDSASTCKISDTKKYSSNAVVNSSKAGSSIKVENKEKKKNRGRFLSKHTAPSGNRGPSNSSVKVSKNVLKHIYFLGKINSGVVFGHKNCFDLRMRVPKNMGWLWNTRDVLGMPPPRLGWKPGAISRYVHKLLRKAKTSSGPQLDSRPSTPTKGKKGKTTGVKSSQSFGRHLVSRKEENNRELELPPTLHIHRKDGTYYVTMYPIKQESSDNPELQEQVKPLQFKVTKNKDDASVCSSSTASDMEIEFSPPAAINRYRKKVPVKNADSQVKQQDIIDAFKSPSTKVEKGKKEKAKK